MQSRKPIYKISKELGIDTARILFACKTLGIYAKGSSKRLSSEEIEKLINYFNSGKNVSSETIEIGEKKAEQVYKKVSIKKATKKQGNIYFPNRLIG
tara:strand:+ start:151 stop:441 length:291 start_codon:yes stop_codon:yes gene_type:complete